MQETLSSYGPLTLPSPPRRGRGKRTLSYAALFEHHLAVTGFHHELTA